jgi:septal ring factor EnvC (AmiA/AmiB activator)
MGSIIAKDKVKIGEYALKASLFDKTQDEMQARLNQLQKTVNMQDAKVNQITSQLSKNEETRRDLEQQVSALKYLEGLQAHADTIELQLEQIRQEETAVNEKKKKVDRRESETMV